MVKKKASLNVETDLSGLFSEMKSRNNIPIDGLLIDKALAVILRQMKAVGLRQRTLSDYELHVNHFCKITNARYIEEINTERIFEWLSSMNVSNQTKLIRLKCFKAFLGRCFNNGWIETKFWTDIKIKVDSRVKEGATDKEIKVLLSLLDLSKFIELRDATAIYCMYITGIRIGTLSQLETKHIDFENNLLKIDGGIIKNHESLYLPFDDVLATLFTALVKQNDMIRKEKKVNNNYLFVSINGGQVSTSPTNNNITKRLCMYAKEYGLKNINAHALRRGFATKLLKNGANIGLISKALGHSSLDVTTRYIHLDKEEVVNGLRNYL
ncbi:tyrosine-type recombinase/integrase [Niallia taxi]|uniref:Site-specific integrase n=1 Tax=Niallia taxi TaxID=2499688 RepID=A0A3S2TU72_9BACI|nr:site-specific integrase [Niallia taxi]RVT62771.1 site-specific integrase [Niallia taxi]